MRRLWAVETRLPAKTLGRRPETDELPPLEGAFSDLCKRPELNSIHRYEGARLSTRRPKSVPLRGGEDCQTNLDSNNDNAASNLDPASEKQL